MDFSENMFGEYDDYLSYESWGPEHTIFIPTTAVKLEKMASVILAIALWNRAIEDGVMTPEMISKQYDWCALDKEVRKWVKALPLPKSLAAKTMNHFYTVESSVRDWISYLFQMVFFDEGTKCDLYQYLGYIIWHPNGIVNSAETARNLLKSNALSVGEKFRLACTYCLQEDIVRIWPTVKYDHQVVSIEVDRSPFLMYYWKCYCAGQLQNIRMRSDVSIEEYMIRKPSVNNWPAIEYFFDRLDAERRVPMVISLIDDFDGHGACFQKLLLAKLEESQRLPVIMGQLAQIVRNYAEWGDNEEIINTWYYVRDMISERDFLALFDVMLERSTKDFVLTEIWSTARHDFKRYVLNYGDNYFITNLFIWCERKQKNRLNFLSLVLLDPACADIRREITKKKVFSEWCKKLITLNALELLSHVENLCFPAAAVGSTEFKLSLTKAPCFKKQCRTLIIGHKTKTLVKLLEFGYPKTDPSSELFVRKFFSTHLNHLNQKCLTYYSTGDLKGLNDLLAPLVSSYPEIMSNYKSKLLMSRPGFRACYGHFGSRNNVLAEIVADGLPAELAAEFKKRIILSPEGIDKVEDMVLAGPLRDAEECARRFLESDSDRKVLRTMLIDRQKEEMFYFRSDKSRRKIMEFLA
ncbi:uncharacterized protein LOC135844396 isoform X7 [Planococcus citri]|uniref:uncharacterized protein LOC135844396 isoform X7 n=1 Tax=Planococcus citri TaxID=170843 RepID=UPI0031F75ADB